MSPSEVSKLIELDLRANFHKLNWLGRPISECLVTPVLKEVANALNENESLVVWLVLEEDPVTRSAYKIVYSQEDDEFGLAVCGSERDVLIGWYGGFVEALCSM